ncbi:MAG: outer membrane protein assembly factor BamE [Reyranella sp.]|jgi:hypothetical protein|nr:outer membrane protein assembly factor BamE [Reyranella sp.]
MKRTALALSMTGLLAACGVHGGNLERVQAGMNREQVQSILGPPEVVAYTPGKDCAYYTVLKDFWSRTPWSLSDRYYVCYADGKVQTFGRADPPAPG